MSSNHHRGPTSNEWHFLISTNRGLEDVTIDELDSLIDCSSTVHHPGMVRCSADEGAVYRLHARARSIHRVMVELARGDCENLDGIYDLVRTLDIPAYLGPNQPFAVRAQRRGDHDFTSMDVAGEVGQAIIDEYRSRKETRPPVDLDDPELIFRIFVRERTVTVTIDTTGQYSLHRRQYRVSEHEAPLRPTIAYAMCQIAGYEAGDRLLDPMCGCGTIPIEAAEAALRRPPITGHEPSFTRFRFLDPERYTEELNAEQTENRSLSLDIVGTDIDENAIESARKNAAAAGVQDTLAFETADATATEVDADVIITDLPFGIRAKADLRSLYAGFFERLAESEWDRLVVHTTGTDFIPLEPTRVIEMRRGRLETAIVLVES